MSSENTDLRLTQCLSEDSENLNTPRADVDSLEKSWRSLQAFNQSQFGRIDSEQTNVNETGLVKEGKEINKFDGNFHIPELPTGKLLTLKICSTWGDPYYVGLNGIEIFSSNGLSAKIKEISANPKDMTIISKFKDDPRIIENLIDGVYNTRDDTHLWLAPFKNENHVYMKFEESTQIAMIRIWNYNKSRIHSYRGVRHLEICLDDIIIFKGELSKAPGTSCAQTEELSDTILFTTDEVILEKVAKNDSSLFAENSINSASQSQVPRPDSSEINASKRPSTGCSQAAKPLVRQKAEESSSKLTNTISVEGGYMVIKGKKFTLELLQNWGAPDQIGLTGLQLLDRYGRPCLIVSQMISCDQRNSDPLSRLFNDRNLTIDESDMWLCKFNYYSPVKIYIRFPNTMAILGFRIWNYNRSFEMSYAGVQLLNFYVEDDLVLRDVSIVKAPGNLHYDYNQDILFGLINQPQVVQTSSLSDMKTGITGFVFQLQLLSTWGDEFYIGLNGIELFDGNRSLIKLQNRNIAAYPESVNVLPDVSDDVRTSDKLIDGINDTDETRHMWLTPILPHSLSRVYIIFDKPTTISTMVIWNYTRTPSRGVRHMVVLVDDVIAQSCEITQSQPGVAASTEIFLDN